MGNTKDAIPIKKESKAAVKVLKQYKTYWVNERSPEKMPNSPDHPLVGRNRDMILRAWCDAQIHKLPFSILKERHNCYL